MNRIEEFESKSKPVRDAKDPLSHCTAIRASVEDYLLRDLSAKHQQLKPCREGQKCGCSEGDGGREKGGSVDLVVLIDTSGSMSGAAASVSAAAEKAIAAAHEACGSDLRVVYFGLQGTWAGTLFLTDHLKYLKGLHPGADFAAEIAPVGYITEQGANAIHDLSNYFDWREGACRSIFYISDEELDGSAPRGDFENEAAATKAAIEAASDQGVTVFANHLNYFGLPAEIIQNYADLCEQTGGRLWTGGAPEVGAYVEMLSQAICNACGGSSCKEAKFPDLHPCLSVAWGDSKEDCLETNDLEVLHITLCNCYSNVTFRNLGIGYVLVTDVDGNPVPALPDGTDSVEVYPVGPICFGDLGPCIDGKPGCKTRQVVLRTRGAREGGYRLVLGSICYEIAYHATETACFTFALCRD